MNVIDEFKDVVLNPYRYAAKLKADEGKKIIGYFCTYAPEELIFAAGAHPLRLFGTSENIHLADSHLQTYSCSLVRGALEEALNGNLNFLDGTVFPHTCDSIQRLSDIWRMNTSFSFFSDVIMPVKLNTESAREYMRDVIGKFRRDLESGLSVSVSDDQIAEANDIYNKNRAYLKEIYSLRSEDPFCISSADTYYIIKGAMIMERRELFKKLPLVIDYIKSGKAAKPASDKSRLILAGSICNHPDIYNIIEESGGVVVWDDLCTGSRYFEGEISSQGDPAKALADRYSSRDICPAKHISNTSRGDNLAALSADHKAKGVIFMYLKFCDPHSWDYPYMKGILADKGVANMLLEVEDKLPPHGQLKTRFEAFMEML